MAHHYRPNQRAARIIVGQPRDIDLFIRLVRNHHMRGSALALLSPGNGEHNARRIRALFDHGFLHKIPEPFIDYTQAGSTSHIYGITSLTAEFLRTNRRALNIPDYIIRKIPSALKPTRTLFLPHRLATSGTLAAIEDACQTSDGQFSFIPQEIIVAQSPEATRKATNPFRFSVTRTDKTYTLTPDDFFGIEVRIATGETKPYYFILEQDRSSMDVYRPDLTQSSIYRKIVLYDQLRTEDQFHKIFGIRDPRILTVVPDHGRLDECTDMIKKRIKSFSKDVSANHFLFATDEAYRTPVDLSTLKVSNAKKETKPFIPHRG